MTGADQMPPETPGQRIASSGVVNVRASHVQYGAAGGWRHELSIMCQVEAATGRGTRQPTSTLTVGGGGES